MSPSRNAGCLTCGDSKFCAECRTFSALKDFPNPKALRRTLNGQGRCDFYRGPNEITKKIKPS